MIVSELVAVIGAKIEKGEFADAALAIEGLGEIALKVFEGIKEGIASAFEAVDKVGEKADALGRLSETLGISAEALQSLGGAAALAADVPWDTFVGGMSKLSIASAKAAAGATEVQEAFGKVSLRGANGQLKATDQLMLDLADDFEKVKNPQEKLHRAVELFGREGGKSFVAFLNKGSAAIRQLQETYSESGAAITQEQIEAAEKLSTSNHLLEFSMKGLTNAFANPRAIEALAGLKEALAKLAISKGIHVLLDRMGTSFAKLLDSMEGFVNQVTEWLGEGDHLARVLDLVTASLGVLAVVMGVVAAESLVSAALTFGPWILAAGLLVLAFDDIKHFIEGKDSLLGRLMDWAHDTSNPDEAFFVKFIKGIIRGVETLIKEVPEAIKYLEQLIAYGDDARKTAGANDAPPKLLPKWIGDLLDDGSPMRDPDIAANAGADSAAASSGWFSRAAKRFFVGPASDLHGLFGDTPDAGSSSGGFDGTPVRTNYVTVNINGTGLPAEEVGRVVVEHIEKHIDQTAKGLGQ